MKSRSSGSRVATSPRQSKKGVGSFSAREIVLIVAACLLFVIAVAGFVLYFTARVPDTAAAKVDAVYIDESEVADWIDRYRISHGLEDDADFASALLAQNNNVSTFRQYAINQLALSEVINNRAKELGLTPTDAQAQEQVDSAKRSFAFNDDSIWEETLADYGLTETDLMNQYKTNLSEEAICEAEVPHREATDDEVLSYMQTYLAGTIQKHAYRIVFAGDEASSRAHRCFNELSSMADAGTLDLDSFIQMALQYSDETDVESTHGFYAWSGADMADEAKEALEYVDVGSCSDPESVEADDAVEIFFCDDEYTFPSADDMQSLDALSVPEGLMEDVRQSAESLAWENDCDTYLASLLAEAKITYYPVPDDAVYNVDLI